MRRSRFGCARRALFAKYSMARATLALGRFGWTAFFGESDGELCFHEASALDEADIAALEGVVAIRVPRLFERRGLLSPEATCEMASWGHNAGFSVDASVRIEAKDRTGLERLMRYCTRPVFASQRLSWAREGEQLRYQLPKPRVDGQTVLCLTPFELLDRLAALIPPPRRHRHRYHGVLAPVCP